MDDNENKCAAARLLINYLSEVAHFDYVTEKTDCFGENHKIGEIRILNEYEDPICYIPVENFDLETCTRRYLPEILFTIAIQNTNKA